MNLLKQARFLMPLFIVLCIFIVLLKGLTLHPNEVPSPLINKSIPHFYLPDLLDKQKTLSHRDFHHQVTLFNVWATWCDACATEHAMLLDIAQHEQIVIYGLDYKDDTIAATKWLKQHGNPYQCIGVDTSGSVAIDWGVYGTPETFIIDKKGIIRYKQIGPITADNWENTLKPLINKLQNEA